MNISCPACDNSTNLKQVDEEKTVEIRKEPITVTIEYFRCPNCGEESRILDSSNDPLIEAYRIYRTKHNMLQPEEIRKFRQQYGLSQAELAKLLGLGGATLSRYERGQLQDKTHDMLIRMAMDPSKLRELVYNAPNVFSTQKRNQILRSIDGIIDSNNGLLTRVINLTYQYQELDEYSGFKKFDMERFHNAVLYFCKGGVIKTKLNKLMFYADFKHFKEYTVSITGARYAHVPFGPAPDGYEMYYPIFARQGHIEIEEVSYQGGEFTGEMYLSKENPALNRFSDTQLLILSSIKEYFKEYNASDISDFSHEEKGYQDTETGDIISYRYAEFLGL